MKKPKESDWKTFRKLQPVVLERFLEAKNRELVERLQASDLDATKRFWKVHDEMRDVAKDLRRVLDDSRRSNMYLQMLGMLQIGMLKDEDLNQFSPELKETLLGWRQEF